jgi:hypothetical protein
MIYVKSFLTGLTALVGTLVLGLAFIFVRVRMSLPEGSGAVIGGGLRILAVSLLAFMAGFIWQYRRLR